jgi:hypothetical protein
LSAVAQRAKAKAKPVNSVDARTMGFAKGSTHPTVSLMSFRAPA